MEKYVSLEMEIIELSDDIIATSGGPNETPKIPWTGAKTAPKPYETYESNDLDE